MNIENGHGHGVIMCQWRVKQHLTTIDTIGRHRPDTSGSNRLDIPHFSYVALHLWPAVTSAGLLRVAWSLLPTDNVRDGQVD